MNNKKQNTIIIVSIMFLLCVFSCKDQFLSKPELNPDNNIINQKWDAPQNLQATQGNKKSITLSWNKVENATRYYIYQASSPLVEFIQYAETSDASTHYTMSVSSGTTSYYKVQAVNAKGETSALSTYIKGTSLSQPVITDIIEDNETLENTIRVFWYMNNAHNTTYKQKVRYIVYCFEGSTEKEQIVVDASETDNMYVTFSGLSSHTKYSFQVKAYMADNESQLEISDKVDSETARRLKPQPVSNVQSSQGTQTLSITLSFELPELVDVLVSPNTYQKHPLYFEISRRELGTQQAFQVICPYFGSDSTIALDKGNNSSSFTE